MKRLTVIEILAPARQTVAEAVAQGALPVAACTVRPSSFVFMASGPPWRRDQSWMEKPEVEAIDA